MVRLFTAIELPEDIKDRLLAVMGGLPKIRWQTRDQLHLTLRFIGEVEPSLAEEIRLALAGVKFTPFTLSIRGIDLFGKNRAPRMLWADIEEKEPVRQLYRRISNRLAALGIAPEERKFTPHITLGRFKKSNGERLERYLSDNVGLAVPGFEVDGFVLFRSYTGSEGAHYEKIQGYPESAQ